jgi:WD40 repeat protein
MRIYWSRLAIKVWDLNTGKLLYTLEGHSDSVEAISVAISDNSKIVSKAKSFIPSAESGSDKTIKFWNLDKGKCYLRYKFDERMVSLTLSKNRNFIALGGESGLYLIFFSIQLI